MGFPSALAGCPPIESGAVRYALSGHSIDFFAAATSKTRVMDMLRPRLAADASILCAGDSGTRSGNDHEMLAHPLGISVGTVCGRPEGCWSMFGRRVTGPDALLRLLEIGRASGRERGCQYGESWVGAGSLKKK